MALGTTYLYNNQSTITPATRKKIEVISRKNPTLGKWLENFFGVTLVNSPKTAAAELSKEMSSLDRYSRNLVQTQFAQELALAKKADSSVKPPSISGATAGLVSGIQKGTENIVNTLDHVSANINETMKPVSTHLGSTLGTLTGVIKDPMGAPKFLANTMGDLVKRVNPNFANKMDATFKKYKMDTVQHLPDQIMGSIKNIMTAADNLISIPMGIISDLYNGVMEVMKSISEAVDKITASVTKFFFGPGGLLDSIIPISTIMEFLDAVNGLAGQLTGISQTFSGFNQIAGFALQAQNYANQFGNFLQNPMDLAAAYAPPVVTQGLYAIQNPQSLINQYMPPQLSQGFATISKITGFGFNGNMGFGLESVLSGLKEGAISSIVGNFAKQYSILTPLLDMASGAGGAPPTNAPQPPALKPAAVNPALQTTHGVVQRQEVPAKVIPTK